ncbi:MAG: hypothetical protein K2L05_06030 [Muribaculaceae bacterium]|nr:hypothetical protein [Muribaculaceae bacterium]
MITDITFYGGWFSKGKFEVEDNELIWWKKQLEWKLIIIPVIVKYYFSLPIDEVAYFVPYCSRFKKILNKLLRLCRLQLYCRLLLGTKESNESYDFKVAIQDIKRLYTLFAGQGSPAMTVIDKVLSEKSGTKNNIKQFKTVSHINTLWLYPEMIICVVKKRKRKFRYETARVICSEARFFTSRRVFRPWTYFPLIMLPKKAAYFGFLDQAEIVLNNQDTQTAREHLLTNGAPFAQPQKAMISSLWTPDLLFKPNLWFVREQIALTNDALIYHRRGLYGTEMAYIPYRDMSFVISKPIWGIFPTRIYLLGQQNIISYKCFSADRLNKLRGELKNHVKSIENNGIVGKPCLLARLCSFNFSTQIIALSNDGVGIIGKNEEEGSQKKACGYSPLDGISEWKLLRKHWYSLVSALWIAGDYGNIRKNQESYFSGYIKGVWICRAREIKSFLKRECGSSEITDKDWIKDLKQIIFGAEQSLQTDANGSSGKGWIATIINKK